MNSWIQWFAMHGYALYIWPAYGIVCVVLLGNLLNIKRQRLRVHKILRQWFSRS